MRLCSKLKILAISAYKIAIDKIPKKNAKKYVAIGLPWTSQKYSIYIIRVGKYYKKQPLV